MNCLGFCVVGAALVASMLFVLIGKNGTEDVAFKTSLSPQQQEQYKQVYKQRLIVFLVGLVMGAVLAGIYYALYAADNRVLNGCAVTAIVLGFAYIYYLLVPKKSMLPLLTSQEQVTLYHNVNRAYSFRSALGMAVGAAGTFLIGMAM